MSTIKNLLQGGHPVAYYPALARAVGGIAPALFLQQIAHWSDYTEDGWVFRTQDELEKELAMSVKVQARCRRELVEAGFLAEQRRQPNARLYYKVDWDKLEAAVHSIPSGKSQPPKGKVSTSPKGDSSNKNKDKSIYKSTPVGTADAVAADEFVAQLDEQLRDSIVPLTPSRKARYGREFKLTLARGRTPEELDEAIDRIVERWEDTQLSVDMAIRDCQKGVQTNGHKRTPGRERREYDKYDPPDAETAASTARLMKEIGYG